MGHLLPITHLWGRSGHESRLQAVIYLLSHGKLNWLRWTLNDKNKEDRLRELFERVMAVAIQRPDRMETEWQLPNIPPRLFLLLLASFSSPASHRISSSFLCCSSSPFTPSPTPSETYFCPVGGAPSFIMYGGVGGLEEAAGLGRRRLRRSSIWSRHEMRGGGIDADGFRERGKVFYAATQCSHG